MKRYIIVTALAYATGLLPMDQNGGPPPQQIYSNQQNYAYPAQERSDYALAGVTVNQYAYAQSGQASYSPNAQYVSVARMPFCPTPVQYGAAGPQPYAHQVISPMGYLNFMQHPYQMPTLPAPYYLGPLALNLALGRSNPQVVAALENMYAQAYNGSVMQNSIQNQCSAAPVLPQPSLVGHVQKDAQPAPRAAERVYPVPAAATNQLDLLPRNQGQTPANPSQAVKPQLVDVTPAGVPTSEQNSGPLIMRKNSSGISPEAVPIATAAPVLPAPAIRDTHNNASIAKVVKVATYTSIRTDCSQAQKEKEDTGKSTALISAQLKSLGSDRIALKNADDFSELLDVYKALEAKNYLDDVRQKSYFSIKMLCMQSAEEHIWVGHKSAALRVSIATQFRKFTSSLIDLAEASIKNNALHKVREKQASFDKLYTQVRDLLKQLITDYVAQTNEQLKHGLAQVNPIITATDALILERDAAQIKYDLSQKSRFGEVNAIQQQFKFNKRVAGRRISVIDENIATQLKAVQAIQAHIKANQVEIQKQLSELIKVIAHALMKETGESDSTHLVLLDRQLLKDVFERIERDSTIKAIFLSALKLFKDDMLYDVYYILQNYLQKFGRIESKGQVWEVTVALWLFTRLEQEVQMRLNHHYGNEQFSREFDVVLPHSKILIECKDIIWSLDAESDMGKKLQHQFSDQSRIAQSMRGYLYVIFSKTVINSFWKEWLRKRHIHYIDPDYKLVLSGIKQLKHLDFASLYQYDGSTDSKSDGKHDE